VNNFKSIFNWFKEFGSWICYGKLLWIYLFLVVAFSFFNRLYLYFGTGLQLLGIITIVIGINNKIKLFRKENPLKQFSKYFARFPSLKTKPILLNISDSIQAVSLENAIIIRGVKKPDQSFADIIRYIDEKQMQTNEHISNLRMELNNQINNITKELNDQRQQLDSNIIEVGKKLELSSISDISLELFGAGCIAAGLVFSIVPLL